MKRILYIVLATLCWGCELDYLPPTEITEEMLVENVTDVEKAFIEAYTKLEGTVTNILNCDYALGDDFVPNEDMGGGSVKEIFEHKASAMYTSNTVEHMYADLYAAIAKCNLCLEQLEQVSSTDTVSCNQLKGEALALRALCHHLLVSYFARPYWDEPAKQPGVVLRTQFALNELPRATVEQVYAQIERDLLAARRLMTKTENAPERFTSNAASALLSRVYLHMGRWDDVVTVASDLIDQVALPEDLSEDCGELFTISALTEGFIPPFYSVNFECLPSEALMNVYDETDYRYAFFEGGGVSEELMQDIEDIKSADWSSIDDLGDTYIGWVLGDRNFELAFGDVIWEEVAPENRNAVIAECLDKLLEKLGTSPLKEFVKFANRDTDGWKVLRRVEVYLNRAEAYWEKHEYALAKADLMTVMEHGGFEESMEYMMLSYSMVPDEELIDYILTERRREFALEGFRSVDLLRRGLPLRRYYAETPDMTDEPVLDMSADDPLRILPIPKKEMRLNGNVVQNEGYSNDRSF